MARRKAREALERVGWKVTPYLVDALTSSDVNVRWEAAKALGRIADPASAPALVRALMDESFEVQWLAAEGLIALGRKALEPLLEGLIDNPESVYMRQGAHHVLHDLERKHLLGEPSLHMLDQLRSVDPIEPYSLSAKRALKALRNISANEELPLEH
jgi:HEAT repeat protein